MNSNHNVAAKVAITELIHLYAYNIRSGLGVECGDLFTQDGIFEIRQMNPKDPASIIARKTLVGRDEIRDYVTAASTSGLLVCPLIHNLLIEVDGDIARSTCMMETRTWPAGFESIGEYQDAFHHTDHGWLFTHRVYTIFQAVTNAVPADS